MSNIHESTVRPILLPGLWSNLTPGPRGTLQVVGRLPIFTLALVSIHLEHGSDRSPDGSLLGLGLSHAVHVTSKPPDHLAAVVHRNLMQCIIAL